MKRRQLIALFGWAAAAWLSDARAQESAIPVVGYLYVGAPEPSAHLLAEFRKGLAETGYVEGRSVAIEYRFAHNRPDRLPELAAELVRKRVAVVVTPSSLPAALAAQTATTTIPIVFNTAGDPVQAASSPASIGRAATSPALAP